MTKSGFPELARIENIQGIVAVMNSLLLPQGITVKAEQEQGCLYVLLESAIVPEQQKMVALVSLAVGSLGDVSLTNVRIYGRQVGDPFTAWSHEITLKLERRVAHTQDLGDKENSQRGSFSDGHSATRVERFLVCGLGNLGQHCVVALKEFALLEFEVSITAIDRKEPETWEFEDLPNLLATSLIIGDCRRDSVLERAGIRSCRGILIVTSDDSVNIETAIAARRINRNIRLLVRSGKQNLNELLKQKLGNFVALDPTELPAATFALAALGEETLGFFNLADHQLRVVKQQVAPGDYRFENFPASKLHKKTQRLLSYPKAALMDSFQGSKLKLPESEAPLRAFYQWTPDVRVKVGDTIIYIEEVETVTPFEKTTANSRFNWRKRLQDIQILAKQDWRQNLVDAWAWAYGEQTRRVVTLGLLTGLILAVIGSVVLKLNISGMSWQAAISAAIILLLGGYGDVFGGLDTTVPVPWWAQFICLVITAFSLLFILSVLGLIADRILSSKFEFLQRRPPVPQAGHVVLVGLGRVGQRIATLLYELKQPFVCLTSTSEQRDFMPQVPLVCDAIHKGLRAVNLPHAASVIMVTDDQMLNLEVALMARDAALKINRKIDLVIRTQDQRFSDHLAGLIPDVRSFCAYALSAEAFVGAAFGENILSLFPLQNQTVLVTEYEIEANDTLDGKILAQVAYGYGVVPIFYHCQQEGDSKLMPSDDTRLHVGDRLVILATINGLRRIERGVLAPCRRWQLQALKPLDPKAIYYAGNELTNISGCHLSEAREFMKNLPGVLGVPGVMELPLYDHQAYRLVQKLRKLLPVRLVSMSDSEQNSYRICIDWEKDWVLLGDI
ncbi:MAG: NAD-binding protein [Stigonema ocellatum SAG 48.90 = DSM 106950]|nr:NAD-binding protein [Stigonema ocellatum SAG 48.90 = DSM 106950]